MENDKTRQSFEKPMVDEEYLMNIMSGNEPDLRKEDSKPKNKTKVEKTDKKSRIEFSKKADYEETFLTNRYPSGRNGKVVYIRSEYHERLLRIVQLAREDKTTLYAYIDNILEHHFREFGEDITDYFNNKYKPIL